jgi:hypothetical protein
MLKGPTSIICISIGRLRQAADPGSAATPATESWGRPIYPNVRSPQQVSYANARRRLPTLQPRC